MKRENLMIDMDDCLIGGGFLYLINEYLGTHYVASDFKDYMMQDVIPNKDAFFKWFLEEKRSMYEHARIYPNSKEVIAKLNEIYNVYICTSYLFKEHPRACGYILEEKFNILTKEFPFLDPYKFIFLGDKTPLNMQVRIDDRLDNLSGAETKILYSAYHNLDLSDDYLQNLGVIRVDDWPSVGRILLKR